VLLARHGETMWNRTGRIQGWAPVGLSDRGRTQARTLGRSLAGTDVDRLVASDLRRTRETVALLREAGVGTEPQFSGAWRERHMGVFQGLTREQLFGTHPEYSATSGLMSARATPEGGESMLDLHERVLDGWASLLDGATGGETILVVTHGGPIYVLLGHVRGMALPATFLDHSQDNCAVTELCVVGDPPGVDPADAAVRVVRENDSPDRGSAPP
jgi:probable phosphoglycerate mutase